MNQKYDVISLGEILLRLSAPVNGRLAQGDTLEFEFTPVVNNVKGFTFCVKPNGSTDGDLVIGVYDGETLCGEEITPIETYEDTVFEMQLTDWKLTAGKTYQMKVAVRDNAAGVILLVTPEVRNHVSRTFPVSAD